MDSSTFHVHVNELPTKKHYSNGTKQYWKGRVKFVDSEGKLLCIGGAVFGVGDPASRALPKGVTKPEPGRLTHEIRLVDSGDGFEAYFEHVTTSFFTDNNTKKVREVEMTAIFNVHNLAKDDEGKPIQVTAVLLEPSHFTTDFAKDWDLNETQVKKLKEKMGLEPGVKPKASNDAVKFWQLRFTVDCKKPLGSGLMTDLDHNENAKLVGELRHAYQNCRHIDYLVRTENAAYGLRRTNDAIAEIAKHDPYDKFWVNNRYPRHSLNLKSGSCLKLNDEHLPTKHVDQTLTFSKWPHYATTMAHGIRSQMETSALKAESFAAELCLFRVTANELFGQVILPDNNKAEFAAGDRMRLHFPDRWTSFRNFDLTAVVTDCIPFLGSDVVPISVDRQRTPMTTSVNLLNHDTLSSDDWDAWLFDAETELIDIQRLSSVEACDHLRRTDKKINVLVHPQVSQLYYERMIDSLSDMDEQYKQGTPDWISTILGNNMTEGPIRSFYLPLDDKAKEYVNIAQSRHFDAQKKADQKLNKLINGNLALTGCGGTGKSTWTADLPQPFIMQRYIDTDPNAVKPICVLFLSCLNTLVDSTYDVIMARSRELLGPDKQPIIIRIMSWSTEKARFKYEADLELHPHPSPRVGTLEPDHTQNSVTRDIVELIRLATQQKFDFIKDKRFNKLYATLGYWMLCFMGVQGFVCSHTDMGKYHDVRDYYLAYATGKDMTRHHERFELKAQELRDDVLRAADVIVTTVSNASDPALASAINPYAIVVDEAGKVSEPEVLCIYGKYPRSLFRIQTGDETQLAPFEKFAPKNEQSKSPFKAQMALSHFTRSVRNGMTSVEFRITHRSQQEICDIISPVAYDDALIPALSTCDRVAVTELKGVMADIIGKAVTTQLFMINTTLRREGKSYKNADSAAVVTAFVIKLLARGIKPASVAITSPYKAQHNLYKKIFSDLHFRYPEVGFHSVQLEIFDTFQGREASIVCVDSMVYDRIGFLGDPCRMNVAMTRARDGLFLFANVASARRNMRDFPRRQFGKFINQFMRLGRSCDISTEDYIYDFETYRDGADAVPRWEGSENLKWEVDSDAEKH